MAGRVSSMPLDPIGQYRLDENIALRKKLHNKLRIHAASIQLRDTNVNFSDIHCKSRATNLSIKQFRMLLWRKLEVSYTLLGIAYCCSQTRLTVQCTAGPSYTGSNTTMFEWLCSMQSWQEVIAVNQSQLVERLISSSHSLSGMITAVSGFLCV